MNIRTRAKISILGTDFLGAMQEEIDVSQIPPEYGGRSGRAIDDSDDERKVSWTTSCLSSLHLFCKRYSGQPSCVMKSIPCHLQHVLVSY